jgi:predicted phosphodiesterase
MNESEYTYMRVAIISDIHGNCVALDSVLAELKNELVDQMVCLGDAVQGGPQPARVVSQLRELACPVVMGNADDFLLTGKDSGAEQISDTRRIRLDAVRSWQLAQLAPDDLAFIGAFQPTVRLPLDDECSLLCYHGSPHSFDHVILPLTPDEKIQRYLNPEGNTIYAGGHTHVQFIRHLGRTFHFNPGSVAFAYRHDQPEKLFHADPWAEYALLNSNNGRLALEFRRVNFDVRQLIDLYQSSDIPYAENAIAHYER